MSLKVLRFASTQDLGCLGRANTTWRDLSLRELTRLPGDWQLRRMGAPDHRVYFRSVAHERAQWEKPSRAAPPPAVDATSDGTPADVYPPQHHWPGRPAPRPKQTWARRRRLGRRLGRRIGRRRGRGLGDGLGSWFGTGSAAGAAVDMSGLHVPPHRRVEAGFLQCEMCGGRKPTATAPGDWAMAWSAGDVFWCSYNPRASQWERPSTRTRRGTGRSIWTV